MALLLLAVIILLLFGVAFLSKRRFGVLGLGLTAGAFMAAAFTDPAALYLSGQGLAFAQVSNETLVWVGLTLLPSILLLFSGPKYTQKKGAVIGGIGYAGLAFLLCLGPLTLTINDPDSQRVIGTIAPFETWAIAVFVAIAVIDMMLAQGPKLPSRGHAKH